MSAVEAGVSAAGSVLVGRCRIWWNPFSWARGLLRLVDVAVTVEDERTAFCLNNGVRVVREWSPQVASAGRGGHPLKCPKSERD